MPQNFCLKALERHRGSKGKVREGAHLVREPALPLFQRP